MSQEKNVELFGICNSFFFHMNNLRGNEFYVNNYICFKLNCKIIMKKVNLFLLIFGLVSIPVQVTRSCTNILVSKGASTDGSTMITYAADSHELYGELYYYPAADHPAGTMLDIYEWDTGKYLGQIEQVPHTYLVVGNMNEHQLTISETTFGGRSELRDTTALMDYGSLMYITLQRAKTAREAIQVIDELLSEYGYYSSGESFSIADPNEVWIMEMISKGMHEKGAVWVARRVPDGYISAHANQARIRQFPLNDPENCLYSEDVIDFAREMDYFEGYDKDFSFADAYAPIDYGALRFCEGRVYSVFNRAAPSINMPMDYVKGVEGAEPMPLWIKPDDKLSVHDVMELMRDHFQGTEWDMTKDIGAGPFGLPYRWRPLVWEVDGVEYCNERAISTQQTGFSFVSQSRSWLPNPIGGVLWFGVDDTYSTVYTPMYCNITEIPSSFKEGNGGMLDFTWNSAFWVFNFVSNFTYLRYNMMIEDVQKVQRALELGFITEQEAIDKLALEMYEEDPEKAIAYLTDYSVKQGEYTVHRWKQLGEQLLVKYIDGNVKVNGELTQPGYSEEWYRKVIETTDDHFEMKKLQNEEHGGN
jgi:dipeptidase